MRFLRSLLLAGLSMLFVSCATTSMSGGSSSSGGARLANHPSPEERRAKIASEETGSFYYGRRYYVEKTRFWGYLREPRQQWNKGRLVIFNESSKLQPDRLPEDGPTGQRFGYDQNHEYRIRGRYTGRTLYEPNSNQFLPEFLLTGYEVLDKNPGWLFAPDDRYDRYRMTLLPR